MREREGRFQRQDFLELLDRAIDVVMEIVDVADLRLQLQIQRVQPLGLLQLDERLFVPPLEQREPPRIPEMRRWPNRDRAGGRASAPPPLPSDPSRGSWRSGREPCAHRPAWGRAPEPSRRPTEPAGRSRLAGSTPRPEYSQMCASARAAYAGANAESCAMAVAEVGDGPPHRVVCPFVQRVHPSQVRIVGHDVERRPVLTGVPASPICSSLTMVAAISS